MPCVVVVDEVGIDVVVVIVVVCKRVVDNGYVCCRGTSRGIWTCSGPVLCVVVVVVVIIVLYVFGADEDVVVVFVLVVDKFAEKQVPKVCGLGLWFWQCCIWS